MTISPLNCISRLDLNNYSVHVHGVRMEAIRTAYILSKTNASFNSPLIILLRSVVTLIANSSVGDANNVDLSKLFSIFGFLHYEIGEVRLHDMQNTGAKSQL